MSWMNDNIWQFSWVPEAEGKHFSFWPDHLGQIGFQLDELEELQNKLGGCILAGTDCWSDTSALGQQGQFRKCIMQKQHWEGSALWAPILQSCNPFGPRSEGWDVESHPARNHADGEGRIEPRAIRFWAVDQHETLSKQWQSLDVCNATGICGQDPADGFLWDDHMT